MSSQAYNSGHRHRERSGYAGQNGRQHWVPGSSGFTNTLASSFDAYPTNYGGEMNVGLVPVGRPTRGILALWTRRLQFSMFTQVTMVVR